MVRPEQNETAFLLEEINFGIIVCLITQKLNKLKYNVPLALSLCKIYLHLNELSTCLVAQKVTNFISIYFPFNGYRELTITFVVHNRLKRNLNIISSFILL